MKRLFFSSVFLFLLGNVLTAQNPAFVITSPYIGLDSDQSKVETFVDGLPRIGDLRYIAWDTLGPVQANGAITMTLPGQNNGAPISFDVLDVVYDTPTEYAIAGKSDWGNISLYVTPLGTGGTIDLPNTTFELFPLGGTKGLLIERNMNEQFEGAACGNDAQTADSSDDDYCEGDCGAEIVDVLAMVTPEARTFVNTTYGIFADWFLFVETHNINLAFANSQISGKRVRVKIIDYTPTFSLTADITDDLNHLSSSPNAKMQLQTHRADIGVLITAQFYPGYAGKANSEDPESDNKFCIAEVSSIGSTRYTFAHEVAHQFGCMHHSEPEIVGCPRGKVLSNSRRTIMAIGGGDNTRIQHFSNPAVFFAGESTGENDKRDNASQIRAAFCEAADNEASPKFTLKFVHDYEVCEGQPFHAHATLSSGWGIDQGHWEQWCSAPVTYLWRWSLYPNFSNPQVIGGNSPYLDLPAPPACPHFYLRVSVTTAQGCVESYTKKVQCLYEIDCERSKSGIENAENEQIFPNPATDNITFSVSEVGDVGKITLFNSTGICKDVDMKSMDTAGFISQSIANLNEGIWFIQVRGSKGNKLYKFIILR